ncbi:hypothetical protein H5410_030003, partial [Solanum commersonii]
CYLLFGTWLDWGENPDKVEETVDALLFKFFKYGLMGFEEKIVALKVSSLDYFMYLHCLSGGMYRYEVFIL